MGFWDSSVLGSHLSERRILTGLCKISCFALMLQLELFSQEIPTKVTIRVLLKPLSSWVILAQFFFLDKRKVRNHVSELGLSMGMWWDKPCELLT